MCHATRYMDPDEDKLLQPLGASEMNYVQKEGFTYFFKTKWIIL